MAGWVAAQQSQQAAKGLRPAGTHSSTNRVLSPPAAAAHLRVRDVGDGGAAGARPSAQAAVVVGHHALHGRGAVRGCHVNMRGGDGMQVTCRVQWAWPLLDLTTAVAENLCRSVPAPPASVPARRAGAAPRTHCAAPLHPPPPCRQPAAPQSPRPTAWLPWPPKRSGRSTYCNTRSCLTNCTCRQLQAPCQPHSRPRCPCLHPCHHPSLPPTCSAACSSSISAAMERCSASFSRSDRAARVSASRMSPCGGGNGRCSEHAAATRCQWRTGEQPLFQ